MVKIVEKFIFEVQSRLESQGVSLEISNDVIKHLAEIGFDPKMGASALREVYFRENFHSNFKSFNRSSG